MSEVWEYGFASPQTGLYYTTTNVLLVETMHAARPDVELLRRPFVPWEPVDSTHEGASGDTPL